MIDDGAPIWLFSRRSMWALTDYQTCDLLSADLGPWVVGKQMTMSGSNSDEAEALGPIHEHGFYCFDPAPTEPAA